MQQAVDVATTLQLGVKALQFYMPDHPRVVEAIAQLEQACTALLEQRSRVSLTSAKGALLLDGEPFPVMTAHCRTLAVEMEKRQIGGVVLFAGARRKELLELARMFTLRPDQIKTAGGAEEVLKKAGVEHVRISHVRYEAVTEEEEVVWSKSVRRGQDNKKSAAHAIPSLLEQYLLRKVGGADMAKMEETLQAAAKRDESGKPVHAADVLRQAMADMDPIAQLALLVSVDQLPEGEAREAFRAAAADPTRALLQTLTGTDEQLNLLRDRLTDMGVTREQLDEMQNVLSWDKLPFDERVEKLADPTRIFDFPAEKLLRFIRQLLDERRGKDVHRLLGIYVTGLGHESLFVRRTVCQTLGQIVLFIKQPGLPRETEQLAGSALLNRVVLEKDPALKNALADAAANFIAMLIATGRSEPALRVVTTLDAAVAAAPEGATVRLAAEALTESFGEAHRANELIGQAVSADPESLTKFVMPLVARLGGAATPAFIEALGAEEDRNRRGRLIKALKAIGEPAFPHLVDALRSQTWFVVRNALNVLGDIGRPEHVEAIGRRLDHGEPRVRRAAARALSKIGGFDAEALLVGALNDRDEETQAEVLLCIGSMKAQTAIPALVELARVRLLGKDEKVRELAITTLGQIGTDAAVNALGDILRAKSLLGRATPATRAAATRALATINTPAARDLLREVSGVR